MYVQYSSAYYPADPLPIIFCYNYYYTDGDSSLVVRLLLACFRQLCGLLWFLHARDQASAHLRKLQPSLSKVSPSN